MQEEINTNLWKTNWTGGEKEKEPEETVEVMRRVEPEAKESMKRWKRRSNDPIYIEPKIITCQQNNSGKYKIPKTPPPKGKIGKKITYFYT